MKLSNYCLLILCFGILSCEHPSEEKHHDQTVKQDAITPVFHPSNNNAAPFSDAVQVGDLYFLSGKIGMDPATDALASGGIEAETKQTLENIKAVLAQHDLQMSDVVKAMVVLDDIEDFAAFNAIYTTYLPQKPARTTFAAEALARGAKIEIEVVAVRRER